MEQSLTALAYSLTALAQSLTAWAQSPTALEQSPTALAQSPTALAQSPTALAQRPTALEQSLTALEQSPSISYSLVTRYNDIKVALIRPGPILVVTFPPDQIPCHQLFVHYESKSNTRNKRDQSDRGGYAFSSKKIMR